jgi:rSAM/selenodomain-associated transferase 1
MSATQLIVMAKAPLPGLAKTRLIPALGADGAARLAASLLEHTMRQARAAELGPVWLACAPDTTHPAFAAQAAQGGVELREQGQGDLGARMQRMVESALAVAGVQRTIVIGADAPGLDAVVLRRADAALGQLEGIDAVFVPALDGGYALIGLRRAAPPLFGAMPWSTAQVMAVTRRRLAAAGLRHVELDPVRDIDDPADLLHLPAGWV